MVLDIIGLLFFIIIFLFCLDSEIYSTDRMIADCTSKMLHTGKDESSFEFTWELEHAVVRESTLNVLAVADPQLQGFLHEPSSIAGHITRFDSDRYIRKAFTALTKYFDADIVLVLGDLLDEGSQASPALFDGYVKRYNSIFKGPRIISIPGDNDVGGEGWDTFTDEKINRFEFQFGKTNKVTELNGNTFVSVETIALSSKKTAKYKETWDFISSCCSSLTNVVVLSHLSIMSLPLETREYLFFHLKPHLILSADTHEFKIYNHASAVEVTIPTISYRMGTNRMGAVLLHFKHIDRKVTVGGRVCSLPDRYGQLKTYALITAVTFAMYSIYFISTLKLKKHRFRE